MNSVARRVAWWDRRASWWCAVLFAAFAAWQTEPLNVATLMARTAGLSLSYADVYSELREQPFAYCDSYYAQREEALTQIRARADALVASAPMAVATMVRDYDAAMSAHYEQDCQVAWRPYHNPTNFQAVFMLNYPLYYLAAEWGVTEIRLALMQIVAGWLGVLAIALLATYFWRSSLAAVSSVIVTSLLLAAAQVPISGAYIPGVPATLIPPAFLFPAVSVLLIVAMVQPAVTGKGSWTMAVVAIAYGCHALFYYAIDPPVARMFALIGVVYVGAVGVVFRNRVVMATAVGAAAVQLVLDGMVRAPGLEIYAAVTSSDHLASDAYRSIMAYMGLLERPSPFGLFYTDEIFSWMIDQDPILGNLAPYMVVHQSYQQTGLALVWEAITTEPFTLIDAAFRRVLIQVLHPALWQEWLLKTDWWLALMLSAMAVVNAWAWRRRALFLALTPVTLCLLFNYFAAHTVLTLVHTHSRWNLIGQMVLFAVAPFYLFVAAKLCLSQTWRWPVHWSDVRARPGLALGVVLAVVALAGVVRVAVVTVRQERVFVQTWMNLHQPPAEGVSILSIVNSLESVRRETGDRRGQIAMWIAAILRMYEARHSDLGADQRAELVRMRHMYFRLAVALAGNNEHYLFAARFLRIDGWESFLLDGLERFPDSVYAPGAVAALKNFGTGFAASSREFVGRQYEDQTTRFLASAEGRIPGFESAPADVQTLTGSVQVTPAGDDHSRPGIVLTMGPGAEALLARRPTHQSPTARLVSYLDLQEGDAQSGVALSGAGPDQRVMDVTALTGQSQAASGRYRSFQAFPEPRETTMGLWLRAGAGGATLAIRDYYPIVDYPKHYYQSGLMERVRRRVPMPTRSETQP